MEILSATAGRYGLQPLMEGIGVTATSAALGYAAPNSWHLGSALVKAPVKVFGFTIGPSLFSMIVATGGAYVEEVVMARDGDPNTWEDWAWEMAKSDLIMYSADFGLTVLLQWGKLKNINYANSMISIPVGAAAGKAAYKYIGKPLLVTGGEAPTYKGYSLGSFYGTGKRLGQVNQMVNQIVEENLASDLKQEGIIQMSEHGWQT